MASTSPADDQSRATAPLGTLQAAAIGALWAIGVGGLFTPRLSDADARGLLTTAAALGALLGGFGTGRVEALRHPALAGVAAVCGVLMNPLPEPTFFVLVPVIAAGAAWPFGTPPAPERALPRWALPVLFALAAFVFLAQSLHRHWTFATGSKDLGLFYQTHWLIARGQPLFNTVMGMHVLADHMTLLDFLVAPLLRLHDSPETLLVVQSLAVASAVFPIAGLAQRVLGRSRAGLALAAAWVLAPDVHSGVLFDYNQTPLGSAALLWFAWALVCRGPVAVLLTALVVCAAKTNFPVYVATVALVLAFRLVSWRRGLAVAGLGAAVFILELTVLVPWFREGGFRHWEYEELGETPPDIASSVATRPDRAAELLVSHAQKRRGLLQPLAATGFVGLADPISLVLQIPNWAERFLSTHRTRWWGYYYGMPAVATALLGALLGWRRLDRAGRAGARLPAYVVLCAALTGLAPPYRTHDGDRRSMLYALGRPYASAPEDVRTQRAAVAFIGRDPRLKVAAQHHLLPHLAGRPQVYMLDRALEADVVALQLDGGTWPEGRPAWRRRLQQIWSTGAFHVAFCQGDTVVLFRGGGTPVACPAWEALVSSAAGAP